MKSPDEIKKIIEEIVELAVAENKEECAQKSALEAKELLEQWAARHIERVEDLVVEAAQEMYRQDNSYSLTIAVWAGCQGTGKGTNIEALTISSKLLTSAYKKAGKNINVTIAPLLSSYTEKSSSVIVGTGGISKPKGEYIELFGKLQDLIVGIVTRGELVGDLFISLFIELMVLVRIVEGTRRLQMDVWPRSQKQFELYDQLIVKLRVAGIPVYTEIVILRLLTDQEITATKENSLLYAELSEKIGKEIKQKLGSAEIKEKTDALQPSNNVEELKAVYAKAKDITHEVMDFVKQKFNIDEALPARIILNEFDRALERMDYRFQTALSQGEMPRADELPQSQLVRLAVFELSTAPSFMRESLDHEIDFICSYESPAKVVQNILEASILKIEEGIFKARHPEIWNEYLKVAGEVAENLVKASEINDTASIDRLAEIIKKTA